MEFGIYTFGDLRPHPVTGEVPTPKERMRQVVELGALAEEVGLEVFAVGEHHRLDMVVSSPAVVLAAVAERTERIRLSSATTVLNTLDPVRVFEDFASLDLLSQGRAEIIAGRGSFTENFDLFGYDLENYDALFIDHLDLLLELNRNARVTWTGQGERAPLSDAEVSPRPTAPIPIWVGVGGTMGSAVRAGRLGLPLNLAILGGPERFAPFVQAHQRAAAAAGHAPPRVAVSSHGHLADDGDAAREEHWLLYEAYMRLGLRNRFPGREIPRAYYDQEAGPRGGIYTGDAKDAIEKARWERRTLGISRLLLQFDIAAMPYSKVRRSVEILGTEVAPVLRKEFPGTG